MSESFLLLVLACPILLCAAASRTHPLESNELTKPRNLREKSVAEDTNSEPDGLEAWEYTSFAGIANWAGADKVAGYDYSGVYEKYVAPLRLKHFHLLEIGLGHGCEDEGKAVGASLKLWRRWLPHARISFIERNQQCAEGVVDKVRGGKIYVGDQSDEAFLNTVVADVKESGGFDVIIDDGGHRMHEQITSVRKLWEALRPGGVYIVEAAITSYFAQYGGGIPGKDNTFMTFVFNMMTGLQCENANVAKVLVSSCQDRLPELNNIDVFPEVVIFVKKAKETQE